MFLSRVNTIEVPIVASPATPGDDAPSPSPIIAAAKSACFVRVRNNSFGQYVLLAHEPVALQTFPAKADTYKLPAGLSETFVLAAGQGLHVSTPSGPVDGQGAEVSFHIYDDLPIGLNE